MFFNFKKLFKYNKDASVVKETIEGMEKGKNLQYSNYILMLYNTYIIHLELIYLNLFTCKLSTIHTPTYLYVGAGEDIKKSINVAPHL